MIKTCIFDLDGTLVDSLEDLANTVNTLLKKRGYLTHPIAAYNRFVGDGVDVLLQRAFQCKDTTVLKELRKEFDSLYQKQYLQKTKPYPAILTMLDTLQHKKIQLAVVTNKPHDIAVQMVATLFPNIFTHVYGNHERYPKKPNPKIVFHVMDLLQVSKEECVYIGDSDVDIQTGNNAGIKTIGVSWGFRGHQELEQQGATIVVDSALEIVEVINDWSQ